MPFRDRRRGRRQLGRHASRGPRGAERLAGSVRIVRCRRNEGKGNALICGTSYAKGDYVAFLDADMDLHPEQLARFSP